MQSMAAIRARRCVAFLFKDYVLAVVCSDDDERLGWSWWIGSRMDPRRNTTRRQQSRHAEDCNRRRLCEERGLDSAVVKARARLRWADICSRSRRVWLVTVLPRSWSAGFNSEAFGVGCKRAASCEPVGPAAASERNFDSVCLTRSSACNWCIWLLSASDSACRLYPSKVAAFAFGPSLVIFPPRRLPEGQENETETNTSHAGTTRRASPSEAVQSQLQINTLRARAAERIASPDCLPSSPFWPD